jgi:hypothetical protein
MPTVDISAGLLPPPACYASEQDRLDAYADALIGNLNTGDEWASQETNPSSSSLYWLRTDTNGRPVEVLKFSTPDSAWVRLQSEVVFGGTSTGAASVYAIANSPVYPTAASAYRTGQIYTFIANHSNTGASTLNVDGQGAKAITKDVATPLVANDILAGQVVSVLYDGVLFQLITQKRDITRISLKQFLYKEMPAQSVPPNGTRLDFNHGFINPITTQGIIPFMVRVVLKRTATGFAQWNSASGVGVFQWYQGQEVEVGAMVSYGAFAAQNGGSNFLTSVDTSQVHVYCNYHSFSPPSTDLFPTLFFQSAAFVPAHYEIKAYAMAVNPLYVEP